MSNEITKQYYADKAIPKDEVAKHTPAPWCIDDEGIDELSVIIKSDSGDAVYPCVGVLYDRESNKEEDRANHNLIIAAPELLEALENIVNGIEAHDNGCKKLWSEAFKAIKKAKGNNHAASKRQ